MSAEDADTGVPKTRAALTGVVGAAAALAGDDAAAGCADKMARTKSSAPNDGSIVGGKLNITPIPCTEHGRTFGGTRQAGQSQTADDSSKMRLIWVLLTDINRKRSQLCLCVRAVQTGSDSDRKLGASQALSPLCEAQLTWSASNIQLQ